VMVVVPARLSLDAQPSTTVAAAATAATVATVPRN